MLCQLPLFNDYFNNYNNNIIIIIYAVYSTRGESTKGANRLRGETTRGGETSNGDETNSGDETSWGETTRGGNGYTMIRTACDCMKKKPGWAALTIQQPDIKL